MRNIDTNAKFNIQSVAVLGGAHFLHVCFCPFVKLWTLDGALERTFETGSTVLCAAALPDGVHIVVGTNAGDVLLYHVDGTLVHTCLLYTSPSPRDGLLSRMPSSA